MKITQRTATLGDAAVLLDWRNTPGVREFSLHSEPISFDEHLHWLSGRLKKVHLEPFFVFSTDHKLIGMSRLDAISESIGEYEISILVNPAQHGKRLGTRILDMTCEVFFNLYPDKTMVAKVHNHNFISQKLFSNAGFDLRTQEDNFLYFKKSLN